MKFLLSAFFVLFSSHAMASVTVSCDAKSSVQDDSSQYSWHIPDVTSTSDYPMIQLGKIGDSGYGLWVVLKVDGQKKSFQWTGVDTGSGIIWADGSSIKFYRNGTFTEVNCDLK